MMISCQECKYHDTWTEQGNVIGYVCKHEEVVKQPGRMYGRYFVARKNRPCWCPLNAQTEGGEQSEERCRNNNSDLC